MDAIPVPVFERHNRCLSCGYDLFGQPRNGVCPECGNSTRESAHHESLLATPGVAARLKSGTLFLLISSILCGFCPGICLIWMMMEGHLVGSFLITLVFAATSITATLSDRRLRIIMTPPNPRDMPTFLFAEILAGFGLVLINLAAYWFSFAQMSGSLRDEPGGSAWLAGSGFFLLSIVAVRAYGTGRLHATVAQACFGSKRGLQGLGVVKSIYETLWLGTCWLGILLLFIGGDAADMGIFFAFCALCGLFGFAGIWIAMIVMHALFFSRVRRAIDDLSPRGFEVVK